MAKAKAAVSGDYEDEDEDYTADLVFALNASLMQDTVDLVSSSSDDDKSSNDNQQEEEEKDEEEDEESDAEVIEVVVDEGVVEVDITPPPQEEVEEEEDEDVVVEVDMTPEPQEEEEEDYVPTSTNDDYLDYDASSSNLPLLSPSHSSPVLPTPTPTPPTPIEEEEDDEEEEAPPPPPPRLSSASRSFYAIYSSCYTELKFAQEKSHLPLNQFVPKARERIALNQKQEKEECLENNQVSTRTRQWATEPLRLSPISSSSSSFSLLRQPYFTSPGAPTLLQLAEQPIPYCSRVPEQNVWIPVHTLVPCADDHVLRYVAYFGDNDSEDLFAEVYGKDDVKTQGMNQHLEQAALAYEQEDLVMEQCLLLVLCTPAGRKFTMAELEQVLSLSAVAATSGGARGKDESEEDAGETFVERCARVREAMSRRGAWPENAAPFAGVVALGSEQVIVTESALMDTVRTLFCRTCFIYDCDKHHLPDKQHELLNAQHRALLMRHGGSGGVAPSSLVKGAPCGPKCCCCGKEKDSEEESASALSGKEAMLCVKLHATLPDWTSCALARTLQLECLQVHRAIVQHYAASATSAASSAPPPLKRLVDNGDSSLCGPRALAHQFAHNPALATKFHRQHAASDFVKRITKQRTEGTLIESSHNACAHVGPCGPKNPDCACQTTFCTKQCLCSTYCTTRHHQHQEEEDLSLSVCKNFFPGCQCSANGGCQTKASCACFNLGIACDPDICHSGSGHRCANCSYVAVPLLLAESGVAGAGWGIFARRAVSKDQFVSDYLGDLVTHDEAERRGRYCDKVNRSYLFNASADFMIDAFRKGNKMRFANHSKTPNCYVRMFTVGRQERVFIFAKRNIKAGEELFFDYCWEQGHKPGKRAAASSSSGGAASAASAGAGGSEGGATRNKWYGKNKKKTAAASAASGDEDDDDDDEEEYDAAAATRRGRCKRSSSSSVVAATSSRSKKRKTAAASKSSQKKRPR